MASIYVQFSDATEKIITSVFSCEQDPSMWPNQGIVDSTDSRYAEFFNSVDAVARMSVPAPG